jgi:hypothetical protein
MLETLSGGIAYHGWRIKVVADIDEFLFCCYHPDFLDFCNDGLTYASSQDALIAARQFVDREIAVRALFNVIGDWLLTNKITDEEYWNLTNFE